MHKMRHIVVQIWKCNSIFGTNWLTNNDFVDVVELIPIVVANIVVFDQWLKFRSTGNGHIQCFGGEETLWIEQIEKVAVDQIREQLIGQTIECRHLWQR